METQKNDNWKSSQLFRPLSAEDSKKVCQQIQHCTPQCQIRLVLTNGLSIAGLLAGRPLLPKELGLTLLLPFSSKWQKLGIPFDLIAGGEVIAQKYSGADYRIGQEEIMQIDENLTQLIEANSLQAESRPRSVSSEEANKSMLNITWKMTIPDISYLARTILYADWDALKRMMEGNWELNPTFGWFGISVSPKKTIQGFTWSKLNGKTHSWESGELPNEDEVVLEGRVNLVSEKSQLVHLNPVGTETRDQDLIAVVWSRIGESECDDNNVWRNGIVGGISLKHVDHPLGFWEKIQNPLRVFGQVIHAGVGSQLGTKEWFLKVLAVGALPKAP